MEILTNVVCPYCGHTNNIRVKELFEKHVFYCNIDSGGCDNLVVAITTVTAQVQVGKVEMVQK